MTVMQSNATRWPWLLCLMAGAVMLWAMGAMGAVPGQVVCDTGNSLRAILRFEWINNPAELASLFGQEPCTTTLANAMDGVNRIDVAAYIPAFTVFQLFAAWGLMRVNRRIALFAVVCALIAGACDLAEDRILFAMADAMRSGEPVAQAAIDPLWWFVRVKFGLLAVAAIALGRLVQAAGRGWWIAGAFMIVGGLVGLAGLIMPALLAPGIGVAWVVLMIAAAVRAWRPVTT